MEDVQQNDDRNWDSQQPKQHTFTHCTLLHIACENAQQASENGARLLHNALVEQLVRPLCSEDHRRSIVGARYRLGRRNQAALNGDHCIFQDEEMI